MLLPALLTPLQENLAEDQNRRLTQHSRRGTADATAKPNKTERERIDKIVGAVGGHLTPEEKDLIYRYALIHFAVL